MMAYSVGGTLISGLQALNLSSGTQIELPSNHTERWSSYRAPSYSAIVKPSTDEDVAAIIKYATNTKTPFLTTGGGHGFSTTLEGLHDGISIDLSNFRDVKLDTARNTLTISGAVRFEDVIGPLGDGKKQLPIGSENCVGMVGAALGGGVSRYNGLHGMLLDTLLSVKMVTASGEIIYVSNTTNADLFWGLRGAGFHFGTILEATFSVFDQSPEQVLLADFLFAPNASRTILDYYKTFDNVLPAELSFVSLSLNAPTLGGSIILVNAVYTGPREEGERYLQPLLQASPLRQNLTMVPWASVNAASFFAIEGPGFHCPTGNVHNVYGSAVHTFDVPTFQTFYESYDALIQSPELAGTVYFIEMFPKQAVEQVPGEATAYPWRNITTHLLFNFAYNVTTDLDERINGFARQARDNFTAVSGFDPPQLYVLYGHGDEDPTTLYSAANLPRLRDLKAKWDPSNAYGYNYPLHDI
ncbi:FAD binding domain-containing protein [Aaosphaeria arxii CBS 175.79]|uniref:FAD binding domain-containing protein n=1 Tax=Aaosphaeria arxii CBS 175.79 TaxID=1450172 RepID=A0A6A5XLC8_9PLEO|nr:FAD binding domain-containing protein [Aaosphaeria arxii CBS 175.79]KAF2014088.1 FAD binding domain-containing protein [Aaosphaeria arxii CBS 175.79]